MRVRRDCCSLGAALVTALAAGVLLLPSPASAEFHDFWWDAAIPGTDRFGYWPGSPHNLSPDSPMVNQSDVTVTHPPNASILIDGGYEVSMHGPMLEVWLNGFGSPATEAWQPPWGTFSAITTAFARFNYSVRVYRLPGALPAAAECYVPINMKAYGTAQVVVQPPAIVTARASFSVPGHYAWDGSAYQPSPPETLEAEVLCGATVWGYVHGQRDLVALADNFVVDERGYVRMTPQCGVVDLEIRGDVYMHAEVALIEAGVYFPPLVEDDGGGRASGYALVDPVFEIEPSWELADWFRVRVSSGVEQDVQVPEPSSGIISVSLVACGLLRLRRRR